MATYRGQEGFVAINGTTLVGEIKSFDLSLRQDSLDVSVMGDSFKRVRGGLKHGAGRATAQFDFLDTGQRAWLDAVIVAPGTTLAGARFYINATFYFEGEILISEFSPKGAYNTIFMVDLTFEFSSTFGLASV